MLYTAGTSEICHYIHYYYYYFIIPYNSVLVGFVLCFSAGIGRTGAFIAIDCLIKQVEAEGKVDVLERTHQMREERMGMIQTKVTVLRFDLKVG